MNITKYISSSSIVDINTDVKNIFSKRCYTMEDIMMDIKILIETYFEIELYKKFSDLSNTEINEILNTLISVNIISNDNMTLRNILFYAIQDDKLKFIDNFKSKTKLIIPTSILNTIENSDGYFPLYLTSNNPIKIEILSNNKYIKNIIIKCVGYNYSYEMNSITLKSCKISQLQCLNFQGHNDLMKSNNIINIYNILNFKFLMAISAYPFIPFN